MKEEHIERTKRRKDYIKKLELLSNNIFDKNEKKTEILICLECDRNNILQYINCGIKNYNFSNNKASNNDKKRINVEIVECKKNNTNGIYLVALHDIEKETEIFVDYGENYIISDIEYRAMLKYKNYLDKNHD